MVNVNIVKDSADPSSLVSLMTDLLSHGHGVRFEAPGRSMYPTIKEGETITVQPVEPCNVKPGDILLYLVDKRVIAHRLVSIERNSNDAGFHHSSLSPQPSALSFKHSSLITQPSALFSPLSTFLFRGDASATFDEPVAAQQVLGKVVSVERGGHSIDLYSWRAKIFRMAFCLKRHIMRRFNKSADFRRDGLARKNLWRRKGKN